MQITLDYSLCSLPHIPNTGQSQLQGKFGFIPLQSLIVLLNSWTCWLGLTVTSWLVRLEKLLHADMIMEICVPHSLVKV